VAGVLWLTLTGAADPRGQGLAVAMFGLVFLLALWLVLWFGVARSCAVDVRLRAAERALNGTRDLHAALSAVRKYGEPAADESRQTRVFFDPLPTVKEEVRTLTRAAQGPPETPPRKGSGDLEIPMKPW
jgi:hypothetical protein